MIDLINHNRRAKIVTIEDPVEFVHENLRSIIIQQEVGTDVRSFREALMHVLRQDPDVIVIGEMRDLETIETALTAAETGHLVLATLHTPDTVQTIQRIYSVFPAAAECDHRSTRIDAASRFAQKLSAAGGRPWRECLPARSLSAPPAIRNHIRERKESQFVQRDADRRKLQMQTMDSALLELYQKGEITYDLALSHAREPDFIRHQTGDTKK